MALFSRVAAGARALLQKKRAERDLDDELQDYLNTAVEHGAASVCGLLLSIAVTRLMSGMLFGVSASDPATLSSVIAIVLTVTALAALVPAMRAALVEPTKVLRDK